MEMVLSPEYAELVNEKVASGQYSTAKDVVEDALRQMQVDEIINSVGIDKVREGIEKGIAQLERGEYKTYSSGREIAEEIKAEGRRPLAMKQN